MPASTNPSPVFCTLPRRLAAVVYDALLLMALWMVGGALWLLSTGGEAVTPGEPLFRIYLLAIAYVFFVGFWLRGGRTLGMQSWRLRVVGVDGAAVDLLKASLRFFTAILSWLTLGLGFLWSVVDSERLTWHDRLSGTRLIVEPKRRRRDRDS